MKRLLILGVLLFGFVLAVAPLSSAAPPPTTDNRETIHFAGGTFDIFDLADIQVGDTLVATTYSYNGPIPGAFGDFENDSSGVAVGANVGAITYSLTINGHVFATDATLPNHAEDDYMFTDLFAGGVSPTAKTMTLALTVNNTHWLYGMFLNGTSVPANPAFFNKYITFDEIDLTEPDVSGLWEVTDRVTNNLGFDMTNTNFTIGYPKTCVQDSPDINPWAGHDFLDTNSFDVTYQKSGPADDKDNIDVSDTSSGTSHTVTVTLTSDDELTDVDWAIDTSDSVWGGAFANINEGTLNVQLSGHDVDWHMSTLTLKSIDVKDKDNIFVFTWTAPSGGGTVTPQAVTPTTTPPGQVNLETEYYGVPAWAILAIAIVVVIAAVAIFKIEK